MKIFNRSKHRALWYKKLYYHLRAGQSLAEAVKSIAETSDARFVAEELQTGKKLSDIYLDDFSEYISGLEISLIQSAEKTGTLEQSFETLSDVLKQQIIQKQKVISATLYPVVIIVLAVVLLLMILVFIVPKIAPLFSDMKNLPLITEWLIGTSDHVLKYWWIDVLGFLTALSMHFYFRSREGYVRFLIYLKKIFLRKMPKVNKVYDLWYLDKWLYAICICLESNTSLYRALYMAAQATDKTTRPYFLSVAIDVEAGNTLASSLNNLPNRLKTYTRSWHSVIQSGEYTGSLLDVLLVCREHVKSELNETLERVQKMIEPLLILLVGLMVLLVCISIMLPMYQLTQSIS